MQKPFFKHAYVVYFTEYFHTVFQKFNRSLHFLGENITSGLSWAAVAEKVATRSEKQCRTKWLNYLNWKQTGGSEWTRDDDILLLNK